MTSARRNEGGFGGRVRKLIQLVIIVGAGIALYRVLKLDMIDSRATGPSFASHPWVGGSLPWPEEARGAGGHDGSWPAVCDERWRAVLGKTLASLTNDPPKLSDSDACGEWEKSRFPVAAVTGESEKRWIYYRAAIVETLASSGHVAPGTPLLAHRLIARMQMGLVEKDDLERNLELLRKLEKFAPNSWEVELGIVLQHVYLAMLHEVPYDAEDLMRRVKRVEGQAPEELTQELEQWLSREKRDDERFELPLRFGLF